MKNWPPTGKTTLPEAKLKEYAEANEENKQIRKENPELFNKNQNNKPDEINWDILGLEHNKEIREEIESNNQEEKEITDDVMRDGLGNIKTKKTSYGAAAENLKNKQEQDLENWSKEDVKESSENTGLNKATLDNLAIKEKTKENKEKISLIKHKYHEVNNKINELKEKQGGVLGKIKNLFNNEKTVKYDNKTYSLEELENLKIGLIRQRKELVLERIKTGNEKKDLEREKQLMFSVLQNDSKNQEQLRTAKKENFFKKNLDSVRNTKFIQWYSNLSTTKKMMMSFAVGGTVLTGLSVATIAAPVSLSVFSSILGATFSARALTMTGAVAGGFLGNWSSKKLIDVQLNDLNKDLEKSISTHNTEESEKIAREIAGLEKRRKYWEIGFTVIGGILGGMGTKHLVNDVIKYEHNLKHNNVNVKKVENGEKILSTGEHAEHIVTPHNDNYHINKLNAENNINIQNHNLNNGHNGNGNGNTIEKSGNIQKHYNDVVSKLEELKNTENIVINKGETFDNLIENFVENNFGHLNEAQQENVVANLIEKIKADPSSPNIDFVDGKYSAGSVIDMKDVVNKLGECKLNYDNLIFRAENLTTEQIQNISQYDIFEEGKLDEKNNILQNYEKNSNLDFKSETPKTPESPIINEYPPHNTAATEDADYGKDNTPVLSDENIKTYIHENQYDSNNPAEQITDGDKYNNDGLDNKNYRINVEQTIKESGGNLKNVNWDLLSQDKNIARAISTMVKGDGSFMLSMPTENNNEFILNQNQNGDVNLLKRAGDGTFSKVEGFDYNINKNTKLFGFIGSGNEGKLQKIINFIAKN